MKGILQRDANGKCETSCHDRVLDAERRRQLEINRLQARINCRQRYAPLKRRTTSKVAR